MYPNLFTIFGLTVHSYGVMLVIAFFVGVWLGRKRAPKYGFTPSQVYDAAFWALIIGIIGARAVFILQEWPHYAAHPNELLTLQFQGLTSFGGVIFGVVGLLVWSRIAKKSFTNLLDLLAAPFLLAHPIGRIGCLLNGCCYGGHCDLPWAIHVPDQPGLFHPAQIYDGIMNLAALGLLLFMEKRGVHRGQSLSLTLMLHGLARFIYEFWRAGTTSTYMGPLPITDAQAAALLMISIGVALYAWFGHKAAVARRIATA
jgi:phosphatidylglycerol:prolipoprotein diacylglycerol transferase